MDDPTELPSFTFSPEEIANIKASVGISEAEEPQEPISDATTPPKRRRRGRPRKYPRGVRGNLPLEDEPLAVEETPVGPGSALPLSKRDEKEVAKRLANILSGATGMGAVVKPYIPMTDEEANAIAEPLASYLIRNEPTQGIAREILDNYDIVAMVLGVGAYGVRVYSDRKHELESDRPVNTTAIQRISEYQASDNGRQPDEGNGINVSVPNATRSGTTPFDV